MTDRITVLRDLADDYNLVVEINLFTDPQSATWYEVWTYDEVGNEYRFEISDNQGRFEHHADVEMRKLDERVPGSGTTEL